MATVMCAIPLVPLSGENANNNEQLLEVARLLDEGWKVIVSEIAGASSNESLILILHKPPQYREEMTHSVLEGFANSKGLKVD